jgi:tetratricopeptide (TPR) repeat protein
MGAAFAAQYDTLRGMIDDLIDKRYLDPLKQDVTNDALRQELIQLLLALHQYDAAITTAADFLLEGLGDAAATYNQLGVAHSLKGDVPQAALYFRQAVAQRLGDVELQRNLDRALQKLGKADQQVPPPTAEPEVAADYRGAVDAAGVDDFYWLE